MSDANGTAVRPLSEVRDEYRRERYLHQIAEHRCERKLLESFGRDPLLSADGSLHPLLWRFWDGESGQFWLPSAGDKDARDGGKDPPALETEADLANQRAAARLLVRYNPVAEGILRALRNYTIRTGFKWRIVPEKEAANPREAADLVKLVQAAFDSYLDVNNWKAREKSVFTRSRRDGEAFVRDFVQDDGMTILRPVEPEHVARPLGSPEEYAWGIKTDPDDVEAVEEYAIAYGEPDDVEYVPAGEVHHLKLNVDETVKRGISDFFCTGEALEGAQKLLKNTRIGESIRAAIVGFWEYESASATTAGALVAAARNQQQPVSRDPVTGKAPNYQRYDPGTIIHGPKGKRFIQPPSSPNAAAQVSVLQACLRSIGVRWNAPEYLVSGDVSNTPFASNLVAGSPFVTSIECEQQGYVDFFLEIHWQALRRMAEAGWFRMGGRTYGYEELTALVDLACEPPAVAIQDNLQRTQIKQIELQNGITSKQQWRGEAGYDNDQIRKDLEEDPLPVLDAPAGLLGLGGTGAAVEPPAEPGEDAIDQAQGTADKSSGDSLRATVGGSQAIAALQSAYYAGQLPRAAAMANARIVFGFTQEEAEELFPEEAPVKLQPADTGETVEGRRLPFFPIPRLRP